MVAPSFVAASTGTTDATGAWSHTCMAPGAAGRLIIFQIFQDGTAGEVAPDTFTNITALDGTANSMTPLEPTPAPSGWTDGSATSFFNLWVGRSTGTSAPVISGPNVGGNDLYMRAYEFQNANTGSTIDDVFENDNVAATLFDNGTRTAGTDASIESCTVITLGPDRLACNFIGVNDDNAVADFTGETGGDWALAVAAYVESGGTDATIALQIAAMASAGTISGGSLTMAVADPWVVAGFAIKPVEDVPTPPKLHRVNLQAIGTRLSF